jgi:hypothetical protein
MALALFLQETNAYHFFFIEQNQLFLFSGPYIADRALLPGGPALLTGEFLVQFFILPYAGAVITAILLTAAGGLAALVCRRVAPACSLYLLSFLPVLCLLFMHFNFNYLIQGTVAFLLALLSLCFYLSVAAFRRRLLLAVVTAPFLFWWAGAVACLYALCVFLWESLNRPRGWGLTFLVAGEVAVAAWASVHGAILGGYRFALLPDMYFHKGLAAPPEIYFSWLSLPLLIAGAYVLRNGQPQKKKARRLTNLLQIAAISALSWISIPLYNDAKSIKLKQLDYYARTCQWDRLIEACQGRLTNYLYLCYLNMALAQKGVLADQAFAFDQQGGQGLFIPWNKTASISTLLSELHFTAGNIAVAQEKAFESYVSSLGYGNPRMLKRLVQTNLIYGEYPVAEKYLDLLDKTFYYSRWANSCRKYLYNDAQVDNDPLLGGKRKGLPKTNFLSNPDQLERDLTAVAEQYPPNRQALEYIGTGYLLTKNVDAFEKLINRYYKTALLPSLPASFQQAVIILYEANPQVWAYYNVSESVAGRFADFKRLIQSNRGNPPVAEVNRLFGDTYWRYYMFK